MQKNKVPKACLRYLGTNKKPPRKREGLTNQRLFNKT
jgi:hypothetical protein